MNKKSLVYYLSFDDIRNKDILFNNIYANEDSNYYVSEDFSQDFYVHLAFSGFICTSATLQKKFYLLAEMQFEYAILDFENLHISKKVKKLIKEDNFEFTINQKFDEIIHKLNDYHKTNWLENKYKELLLSLKNYKHLTIDFKIMSIELNDKNTNELIAGEIGYKIGSTYTSLTGFSSKDEKYKNWGKLQMVLLCKYLEQNRYSFWNLGHPYMQYKFDLGAKKYSRLEFLKRWIKEVNL